MAADERIKRIRNQRFVAWCLLSLLMLHVQQISSSSLPSLRPRRKLLTPNQHHGYQSMPHHVVSRTLAPWELHEKAETISTRNMMDDVPLVQLEIGSQASIDRRQSSPILPPPPAPPSHRYHPRFDAPIAMEVSSSIGASPPPPPMADGFQIPDDGLIVKMLPNSIISGRQWMDRSKASNHAFMCSFNPNESSPPQSLIVTNNGKSFKVMHFEATSSISFGDNLVLDRSHTVMIVDRYSLTATHKGRLLQSRDINWVLGLWNGARAHYAEGWVGPLQDATPGKFAISTATMQINVSDASSASAYHFNAKTVGSAKGLKPPGRLALGPCGLAQTVNERSEADVAAILVWNRVLTDKERMSTEFWLATQFGVLGTDTIIPACYRANGGCDYLVSCDMDQNDPINGAVRCGLCPGGYSDSKERGDFRKCIDIDECVGGAEGKCDKLTKCINTPGSYDCSECPEGYEGNGKDGCRDLNECKLNNGGCDPLQECINTPGSFHCGECPKGYMLVPPATCEDVNECTVNNGGCDPKVSCQNTKGSRICGYCPPGFDGDGESGCKDRDECLVDNGGCDVHSRCRNTPGSRECSRCLDGYAGEGETGCVDVNECTTGSGACDPNTVCYNTEGSFVCGPCPTGFIGNGKEGCGDIDECADNNGGCFKLSMCRNVPGSRLCGACPSGFTGNGIICQDMNECWQDNGGCDPLTKCVNIPGSRECGVCPAGYLGNGVNGCLDIDECATDNGHCDPNVECRNVPGGRTCGKCPAGYLGDGYSGCIPDTRHLDRNIVHASQVEIQSNSGPKYLNMSLFQAKVVEKVRNMIGMSSQSDAENAMVARTVMQNLGILDFLNGHTNDPVDSSSGEASLQANKQDPMYSSYTSTDSGNSADAQMADAGLVQVQSQVQDAMNAVMGKVQDLLYSKNVTQATQDDVNGALIELFDLQPSNDPQ